MSYKTKLLAPLCFVVALTIGAFGEFSQTLALDLCQCAPGQECRNNTCVTIVKPDKTAVAPEPPVVLLLGLGLATLIAWQWKYARRAKL